jgi:hypothetical protein
MKAIALAALAALSLAACTNGMTPQQCATAQAALTAATGLAQTVDYTKAHQAEADALATGVAQLTAAACTPAP